MSLLRKYKNNQEKWFLWSVRIPGILPGLELMNSSNQLYSVSLVNYSILPMQKVERRQVLRQYPICRLLSGQEPTWSHSVI